MRKKNRPKRKKKKGSDDETAEKQIKKNEKTEAKWFQNEQKRSVTLILGQV